MPSSLHAKQSGFPSRFGRASSAEGRSGRAVNPSAAAAAPVCACRPGFRSCAPLPASRGLAGGIRCDRRSRKGADAVSPRPAVLAETPRAEDVERGYPEDSGHRHADVSLLASSLLRPLASAAMSRRRWADDAQQFPHPVGLDRRAGQDALHHPPHMLRHACGYAWRDKPRCHREYRPRVGPELLQPQFIDQQRLNDDRAFSNEPRPKPCMANELSEQFQIGIRREEHI